MVIRGFMFCYDSWHRFSSELQSSHMSHPPVPHSKLTSKTITRSITRSTSTTCSSSKSLPVHIFHHQIMNILFMNREHPEISYTKCDDHQDLRIQIRPLRITASASDPSHPPTERPHILQRRAVRRQGREFPMHLLTPGGRERLRGGAWR